MRLKPVLFIYTVKNKNKVIKREEWTSEKWKQETQTKQSKTFMIQTPIPCVD